jgi:hypothetical protein
VEIGGRVQRLEDEVARAYTVIRKTKFNKRPHGYAEF